MRTRQWLPGLILCVAGIGSVTAASVDTQDIDSATHASSEAAASARESSGGDALGLGREHGTHGSSSGSPAADSTPGSSSGSTTGSAGDRSGASGVPARPAQQPRLGWQSLLPGSIQ